MQENIVILCLPYLWLVCAALLHLKFLGGWVFFLFVFFFKRLLYVERTSIFSCEQSDVLGQLQFIFNNLLVMLLYIRILMYKYQIKYVCT